MQFINARFGGTIYGDVQTQLQVQAHSPKRNGGVEVRHGVLLEGGSCLDRLVGQSDRPVEVNSYHLQAVGNRGGGCG